MPLVTIEDEDAGLAAILAELVRGNLEADPARERFLRGSCGSVGIVADDGTESVEATIVFDGASLIARSGLDPRADVIVRSSYEGVLGLSRVPMRGMLPLAWRREALDLVRAMARGDLKVTGLWFNPRLVLRLLALVSVGS